MPKILTPIAIAVAAWIGLASGQAQAASQILGIVASNGLPTPLHCEDGTCVGHFSTFCLQDNRPAPPAESVYQLLPGDGSLTVIATLADGRTLRLPANDLLAIHTRIGFTSVRMSLPESQMKALGAVSLAVDVAPMTAILPRPVADDPNPQSAEEIALATGPVRRLAERSFESRGDSADAARLASLVINLLPEDEPQTAPGRHALWTRALALASSRIALSPGGIDEARNIYSSCEISVASKSSFNLRSCMELHHADLMAVTNRKFWDDSGGS